MTRLARRSLFIAMTGVMFASAVGDAKLFLPAFIGWLLTGLFAMEDPKR